MDRRKLSYAATLFLLPTLAFAESTISQPIVQLQYDAAGDSFWLTGISDWGATSCPSATFIRVPSSLTGYKQLLAIVLSAKAAGQSVKFAGSCFSDPDYFTANYVFVD